MPRDFPGPYSFSLNSFMGAASGSAVGEVRSFSFQLSNIYDFELLSIQYFSSHANLADNSGGATINDADIQVIFGNQYRDFMPDWVKIRLIWGTAIYPHKIPPTLFEKGSSIRTRIKYGSLAGVGGANFSLTFQGRYLPPRDQQVMVQPGPPQEAPPMGLPSFALPAQFTR